MFSCLFSDNMAQDSATIENGCGSSVVEHSLGKGEVESSILSRSTILFFFFLSLSCLYKPSLIGSTIPPNTALHNKRNENTTPSLLSPVKKHVNLQLESSRGNFPCPSNPQHKSGQNRPPSPLSLSQHLTSKVRPPLDILPQTSLPLPQAILFTLNL